MPKQRSSSIKKKTTKKNKPKTTQRVPARTTNRLPTQGVTFRQSINPSRSIPNRMSVREAVCAITDPFCVKAKNTKWPDGNGGETMTMQIRTHNSIAPFTGTGQYLTFWTPSLPYGALTPASLTSGTYTMASTYSDVTGGSGTNFSTYCSTYRVVTAGIIIRNVLPALTAQGYITVSRQTLFPAPGASVVSGNMIGSDIATHPIVAGMEIPIVFRTTGMDARNFDPQGTTTTFNDGWDIIKVEISGTVNTATPTLDIEFVANVEFTLPTAQVGLHSFVTPHVPVAPHAIIASQKLMNLVPSTLSTSVDKLTTSFLNKALFAIGDVVEGGLTMFGI